MKKTNLTMYPVKTQVQLIKLNRKIQVAMVESKTWEQLRNTILSMVEASEEALTFFEKKYKTN